MTEHLQGFLSRKYFEFLGGADYDRFMIELAQALACWPPSLFTDPLGHLLSELGPVVAYPTADSESAVDILFDLRQKLGFLQKKLGEQELPVGSLQELYMKGDYRQAVFSARLKESSVSDEDRQIAGLSFVEWGTELFEKSRMAIAKPRRRLLSEAEEKYRRALALQPHKSDALNNLANVLFEQDRTARGAEGEKLFIDAIQTYKALLAEKPDAYVAWSNWGASLFELAKRNWPDSERLFSEAIEKYKKAVAISPGYHVAIREWVDQLGTQARRLEGDQATAMFARSAEKFQAALALASTDYLTIYRWGGMLLTQAAGPDPSEKLKLLDKAAEKLEAAARIGSTHTYNLARLAALRRDEDRCRLSLEIAAKRGTLPIVDQIASDADFEKVRTRPWFQELLQRVAKSNG